MSNFIKNAYFTGVQDALVNFGLAKHAAPAPIYDNPYEDAPAPAAPAPKSSKSLSDMSDSDIDAMVAKIPASKGSASGVDSLLAGLPPRDSRPPREETVFTLDDYNLGDSPAPKKKSPSKGGGKVTYVNIPEYPEDVITAKKPPANRQAFPGSDPTSLVNLMSNPMTRPNLSRQIGLDSSTPAPKPAGPEPLATRRGGQSSMPAKSPSGVTRPVRG